MAGGPATDNPADYEPVFAWTTYTERLQKAGVSWQVYADAEVGDGEDGDVGDYGDNPLWLFQAYHDALASTDPKVRRLADRASLRTAWKPDSGQGKNIDHVLAEFLGDCATGSLPAVSWVVASGGRGLLGHRCTPARRRRARGTATATVPLVLGAYDVAVHGPNGFLRTATGDPSSAGVEVAVAITGTARRPTLTLRTTNAGTVPATLTLTGGALTVPAGAMRTRTFQPFDRDHGWYDITATWAGHPSWVRRFAGHLENGLPSVTG